MLINVTKAFDAHKEELRKMFEMMDGMGHDNSADLKLEISMGTSFHPTIQMRNHEARGTRVMGWRYVFDAILNEVNAYLDCQRWRQYARAWQISTRHPEWSDSTMTEDLNAAECPNPFSP